MLYQIYILIYVECRFPLPNTLANTIHLKFNFFLYYS